MSASKSLGVLALLALAACEATPAPDLPDWSPGFPSTTATGTGTGTGTATGGTTLPGGVLELTVNLAPQILKEFGQKAAPAAPCAIDNAAAPYTLLECQLEMNELDLYFHGWSYDLKIPKQTCEYLAIANYMYEAWEDGLGPADVEVQVNEDGDWVADVLNASFGEPVCQYDYTNPANPEAPNCCYGTYTYTTVTVDPSGTELSRESTAAEWGGGPIGDCYAGAAYASSVTAIDPASGLAVGVIVDIDEEVDNIFHVDFNPPADKPESSTLRVANYYRTADGVPAGLFAPFAQDHYAIECLDRAFEINARFEIDVREWDEKSEYIDGGDPDSGVQPSAGAAAPLEANGSGSPINDFWDWRDFALNGIDYVRSWD